jgi:hypothetical protein
VLRPFTKLLKIPPVRRLLTPAQVQSVSKKGKLKTDCSGRRFGKTWQSIAWLIEEGPMRPRQSAIFAALTTDHAVRIAWDAIEEINRRLNLGGVYTATPAPVWTWPNGYQLYLVGLKDMRQVNHLRGIPKIWRIVIDESGQVPDPLLEYAVRNVIQPALADTDGELWLTGTPADTGIGFYEDQMAYCEARGTHTCHTMADNPHLAKPGAELIAEMLRENYGGDAENATFRREILGHRIRDEGVLVYRLAPNLDEFYEATPILRPSSYVTMGIDIGWNDGVGFSVVQSRDAQPGAHVRYVYREAEMSLPRIAAVAERLRVEHQVGEIFVDTAGGGGRTLMETLASQYGLPAQAADKRNRRMRIEQLRAMLDSRTLRGTLGATGQLLDEFRGIPWNGDHDDHREGYVDETVDATQYALQGGGFSFNTSWAPVLTPQQEMSKAIAEIQKNRRRARSSGRR